MDLPLESLGFPTTGQTGQLFNQGPAFLPGNKIGGLHCINQKLQFRKFKLSGFQIIANPVVFFPPAFYRIAESFQRCKVVVDRLTFRCKALLLQPIQDFSHGQRMLRICFPQEDFEQI